VSWCFGGTLSLNRIASFIEDDIFNS
jgi:hypothetical protein